MSTKINVPALSLEWEEILPAMVMGAAKTLRDFEAHNIDASEVASRVCSDILRADNLETYPAEEGEVVGLKSMVKRAQNEAMNTTQHSPESRLLTIDKKGNWQDGFTMGRQRVMVEEECPIDALFNYLGTWWETDAHGVTRKVGHYTHETPKVFIKKINPSKVESERMGDRTVACRIESQDEEDLSIFLANHLTPTELLNLKALERGEQVSGKCQSTRASKKKRLLAKV